MFNAMAWTMMFALGAIIYGLLAFSIAFAWWSFDDRCTDSNDLGRVWRKIALWPLNLGQWTNYLFEGKERCLKCGHSLAKHRRTEEYQSTGCNWKGQRIINDKDGYRDYRWERCDCGWSVDKVRLNAVPKEKKQRSLPGSQVLDEIAAQRRLNEAEAIASLRMGVIVDRGLGHTPVITKLKQHPSTVREGPEAIRGSI
jgi:hypothetical protein